jgi:hypothetical protein
MTEYPNFKEYPLFLNTTDANNNLLIDRVDRATVADSVNLSGVVIDVDKDWNGKSITNINSITAVNGYITNLMKDLNMNNFSISGVNNITTTTANIGALGQDLDANGKSITDVSSITPKKIIFTGDLGFSREDRMENINKLKFCKI